jgi:hypothetical protein
MVGKEPEGINRTFYDIGQGLSNLDRGFRNTVVDLGRREKAFYRGIGDFFGGKTPNWNAAFNPGAPAFKDPNDLRGLVSGSKAGSGPMGADARDGWDNRRSDGPAQQSDPYLDFLQSLFDQAGQSSGPNLSGYDSALADLETEKTRVSDRYKKYSGQISDIYGTLTGITQADIANIKPAGESVRSTLSAQEAERAEATRASDAARLAAATEARAALGLGDLAGEYAEGDIATEQSEGMITDSEAQRSAAENTLLANEAIAQQAGQNRITGYGLQQEQSAKQLQTSLEDVLAQIAAQQSQIKMQRAQAAGSGRGPDIGAQLQIMDRIQQYNNPQVPGEPTPLDIFGARTGQGTVGRQAADTFAEWISNTENYEAIPAVRNRGKANATEIVAAFLTQAGQNKPAIRQWAKNSDVYNLLINLANTAG